MTISDRIIAGRYRLTDRIGAGGMGMVWLAEDEILHREVAIKEILIASELSKIELDELRLRTLREARTAARLTHPNVVRVYDVLFAGDRPWIVMEYVASRSLAQVVRDDRTLTPRETAQVGIALVDALSAAHDAGVLHRDIKPGNVLLADDGRVMLTDFGLATFDEIGSTTITQTGVVHGSPQFIAPERALDGTSSAAADMWSLGATLYAAVEGRSPYSRPTSYEILSALATSDPDPMVYAGPLTRVLNGLLRRDPAKRMAPSEMRARLQRIVDEPEREVRQPIQRSDRLDSPSPRSFANAAAMPLDTGSGGGLSAPSPSGRRIAPERISDELYSLQRITNNSGRRRALNWRQITLISTVVVAVLILCALVALKAFSSGPDTTRLNAGPLSSPTVLPTNSSTPFPGGGGGYPPPQGQGPGGQGGQGGPGQGPPGRPRPADIDGMCNPIGGPNVPVVPTGAPSRGAVAPHGWVWHVSPTYYQIALPDHWHWHTKTTALSTNDCFYAQDTSSQVIGVDRWTWKTDDALEAARSRDKFMKGIQTLPGYEFSSFGQPACAVKCADWIYTWRGPSAVLLHVVSRVFLEPHDVAFTVTWTTLDNTWQHDLPRENALMASFAAL